MPRCPGQDMRYWKAEDIFDVRCPYCERELEFWKDEPVRICPSCDHEVRNPRIDLGCAKWCKFAEECLGKLPETAVADPLIERLKVTLEKDLGDEQGRMQQAREVYAVADIFLVAEPAQPCVVKAAALLAGALMTRENPEQELPAFNEILSRAGIQETLIAGIINIVGEVLQGKVPDSREGAMIWDAVALEKMSLLPDSPEKTAECKILAEQLKTTPGRSLAQKRMAKMES